MASTLMLNWQGSPVTFGAKTKVGEGGYDLGASAVTISSGNASGHWQVVTTGGRYYLAPSTTGDTVDLNAGPYNLVMSDGTKLAVSVAANAFSVRSFTELQTRLQASGIAYGDKLYMRGPGGNYPNGAMTNITPVAFSGTFSPPSNYGSDAVGYAQGVDLDTGNYVRIMPHPGESVTCLGPLRFYNQATTGYAHLRVSGLTFQVYDVGSVAEITVAMLNNYGGTYFAVDGCTFQGLDTTYGEFERRNGFINRANTSFIPDNIVVQNNTFLDCYTGFSVSAGENPCVVGNKVQRAWADCIKIAPANNIRLCWNYTTEKRDIASYHGDSFQMAGNASTPTKSKGWYIGNVLVLGGPLSNGGGQGLFTSDIGSTDADTTYWDSFVVVGNRILSQSLNGVYFGGGGTRSASVIADGTYIRNNHILNDPTLGVNGTKIRFNKGVDTNRDQNYNLVTGNTGSDMAAPTSSYPTYLVGGSGQLGTGGKTTLAGTVSDTNIVAGSAPDLTSPKTGAHQDYFDYVNRTFSLPYSLPTHP